VDELRQAIRLNPDDERSRTMLADVFSDARQFDAAERTLVEAASAMPRSGQIHWRLGRLFQVRQRDVEARAEFERSLSLDPVAGAGRMRGAVARWYLREANLPAATEAARHYVDADLNDPAAHKELGNTLRTAGHDEEALVELLLAAWLNPEDGDTW